MLAILSLPPPSLSRDCCHSQRFNNLATSRNLFPFSIFYLFFSPILVTVNCYVASLQAKMSRKYLEKDQEDWKVLEEAWKTLFSARWNNFMKVQMVHLSEFFQLVALVKLGWIVCLLGIMTATSWLMLASCFLSTFLFKAFHWNFLDGFFHYDVNVWIFVIYLQPWWAWCPENYTWYHIYQKMESQNRSCCYYTWPWRSHWCVALGKVSF